MASETTNELNKLLQSGTRDNQDSIFALVYTELRNLAVYRLNGEAPGQTIGPTALVHEAYLRLCNTGPGTWKSRDYFFGAAAEAMRRIVVERARQKRGLARGGQWRRIDLDVDSIDQQAGAVETLEVNAALEKLEDEHPQVAALVKLRYFGGFNHCDAADALGLTRSLADRYWVFAKAYLLNAIRQIRT